MGSWNPGRQGRSLKKWYIHPVSFWNHSYDLNKTYLTHVTMTNHACAYVSLPSHILILCPILGFTCVFLDFYVSIDIILKYYVHYQYHYWSKSYYCLPLEDTFPYSVNHFGLMRHRRFWASAPSATDSSTELSII